MTRPTYNSKTPYTSEFPKATTLGEVLGEDLLEQVIAVYRANHTSFERVIQWKRLFETKRPEALKSKGFDPGYLAYALEYIVSNSVPTSQWKDVPFVPTKK